MYAWRAVYSIRDRETGRTKVMEYHVAAASVGDVPEAIRKAVNLDGSEVLYAEVSRLREPELISVREIKG